MKRVLVISVLTVFVVVLFISCSDTESPTVSITYPANLHVTYGVETLRADASDNDKVSKVEFMIDGLLVGTDQTAPYECIVDFSDYSEGTHSVTAKAYDKNDNSTISDPISVIYVYDFAPSGNGLIRVKITSYQSDGRADDPYFVFELGVTLTAQSSVFENSYTLINPYYHDFDIDDGTEEFDLTIWVYNDNWPFARTVIDYCPDAGYGAYKFNLNTRNLPYSRTYDGADDGVEPEDDCKLSFTISIVTE